MTNPKHRGRSGMFRLTRVWAAVLPQPLTQEQEIQICHDTYPGHPEGRTAIIFLWLSSSAVKVTQKAKTDEKFIFQPPNGYGKATMQYEPYKTYKDRFNVYALCTASDKTYSAIDGYDSTFFDVWGKNISVNGSQWKNHIFERCIGPAFIPKVHDAHIPQQLNSRAAGSAGAVQPGRAPGARCPPGE